MEIDRPSFSEGTDTLTSHIRNIDDILRRLNDTLADLSTYGTFRRDIIQRIEQLENTVNRLNSFIMDLKNPGYTKVESSDRLSTLETMVNKISTSILDQKAYIEHQMTLQNKSIEDLKKELAIQKRKEEEIIFHEIEEMMRHK